MDILLTGGSGQVGQCLRQLAWPKGILLHAPNRCELDLSDETSLRRFLAIRPWAAVINAGAYTAVDLAEADTVTAWRINALAPAIIADFARHHDVPVLHISTDYVFSGESDRPWLEDDPVAPFNVYGASKEGGEQAIRVTAARHIIMRTSWLISPFGKNFAKTVLHRAKEGNGLKIVGDQIGRPTIASSLANVVQHLVMAMIAGDPKARGTFHAASQGEASWADLARAIMDDATRCGLPHVPIETIATHEYRTPARRPRYSALSTAKLERDFGLVMPHWRKEVLSVVECILASERGSKET